MENFTKVNLKNGMVVKTRDRNKYLYMNNKMIGEHLGFSITEYDKNLLSEHFASLDIVEVYSVNWEDVNIFEDIFNNLKLVWSREKGEIKEYPMLYRYEYETLLRENNNGYHYIIRDVDNHIYTFRDQPHRQYRWLTWINEHPHIIHTEPGDFDFIEWATREPWSISELLDNCQVRKK